jgi:hypothetical protein
MWNPTGNEMSGPAMAYQQPSIAGQPFTAQFPIVADPMVVSEPSIAAQPTFDSPNIASGPVLTPQADPAHSNGAVAGLPVVDPY